MPHRLTKASWQLNCDAWRLIEALRDAGDVEADKLLQRREALRVELELEVFVDAFSVDEIKTK